MSAKEIDYKKLKNKWLKHGEIPKWLSSNGVQLFCEKYSYKGDTFKQRLQSVAKHLAKRAPKVYPEWWGSDPYTTGKTYEEVFFNVQWDGYVTGSTPLIANSETDRGMTVSCSGQYMKPTIYHSNDMVTELAVLSKYGHGTSVVLSDWPSEGMDLGDGNKSAGVMPQIKKLIAEIDLVTQGVRRGSAAYYIDIEHGDFYKVAQHLFEEPDSNNVGWIVKQSFIDKLKAVDKEAIKRFNRVLYVRRTKGKGYICKIDTFNKHRAEAFKKDEVYTTGSNLCVAPETKILTDKGYQEISTLVGEVVNVWNGEEWSAVVVQQTGSNQKLLKVVTDIGQDIECTEYHRFFVQTDYQGTIECKRAFELKAGDKLIKFKLPVIQGSETLEYAYDNGFFSADGTCNNNSKAIYLYHAKRDLADFFKSVSCWNKNDELMLWKGTSKFGSLQPKYFVPNANYTVESRLQWLAGYLDGDGCVARNGTNESIQAVTIHYDFAVNLQNMLQELGVNAKITHAADEGLRSLPANDGTGEYKMYQCKRSYRILINSIDLQHLTNLGLKCHRLKWEVRTPQRSASRFVQIVDVVDEGRYDDTYCFTEPKRGMGMFNGVLAGNCLDMNLPANDELTFTCVLLSLNLLEYDKWPTNLPKIAHIMQDCNVSAYLEQIEALSPHNFKALEKAHRFTKRYRAVGTGTYGFHSYLMKKRIVFGSLDAFYTNGRIFKDIHSQIDVCNRWLAEVLGEPEGCKGLGIRNATTTAGQPTKSSAELSKGSPSESINPVTALVKVKESAGGELFRIDTVFLEYLKENGLYNDELIRKVAKNKGSVQGIDEIPKDMQLVFATAFEVKMEDHLNLCSQRRKYIDNSQSINLYFGSNDTEEYIAKIHQQALLDDECLGLYYVYGMRNGKLTRLTDCFSCQ